MKQNVSVPRQKFGHLITKKTIDAIVTSITEKFNPLKIILFGSYGSGHATTDSDLDLLIIMDTELPKHRRVVPIRLFFNPPLCPMDIIIYTPEEVRYYNGVINHMLTEIFETGKILYERAK